MIQTPPRTILEVFESLPEGTLCQLINNNLVMTPSPNYEHQQVSKIIFRKLDAFVEANGLGEVLYAPIDVYLGNSNVFQPDILFIARQRLTIIQEGKIKGAPDLVIEILSPGTEAYDSVDKKAVYEQAGVKEYWLVDPRTKAVQGYHLADQQFFPLPSATGSIQSALLGTTIEF